MAVVNVNHLVLTLEIYLALGFFVGSQVSLPGTLNFLCLDLIGYTLLEVNDVVHDFVADCRLSGADFVVITFGKNEKLLSTFVMLRILMRLGSFPLDLKRMFVKVDENLNFAD